MRVVGYIRVSRKEQAKHGVSLEDQAERLAAHSASQKLDLVAVEVDPGASGKSLRKRPGLDRALARLRAGEAEGLLVLKLDRLTRSVEDLQVLVREYFGERKPHWQLFSVHEAVNTRRANGRVMLNIMMSLAQGEREQLVERTKDALDGKRGRGERTGAIPYGYRLVDDGRRSKSKQPVALEVEPTEALGLARIAELARAHKSLREIARAMTEEGFATRKGRPWRHETIDRILKRHNDGDQQA